MECQTYSNPTKVMGLCGSNGNGQKFLFLLELEERMNIGRYVGLMRKVADKINRSEGTILHTRQGLNTLKCNDFALLL